MSLADDVRQAASHLQKAAEGLAGALESRARLRRGKDDLLSTYREAEAIAITCSAVLEEGQALLDVMDRSDVVGRSNGGSNVLDDDRYDRESDSGSGNGYKGYKQVVCNGFDSLGVILRILLEKMEAAVKEVASNWQRWLVSVIEMRRCFEKMSAHHAQLRGFYGIIHLVNKIIASTEVKKTLFVDIGGKDPRPELAPMRWRNAVRMDEFYGRYFGFHYKPEMRNVLRVVNIARGSVDKVIETAPELKPSIVRNMAVLVWGIFYSNVTIMSHLGVPVEGAANIGSDTGKRETTVDQVRTFMNLVEDPLIAGVAGLTSRDVAIDKTFEIPVPCSAGADGLAKALGSSSNLSVNGHLSRSEHDYKGAEDAGNEARVHWTSEGRIARKISQKRLTFKAGGPIRARLVSYMMRPVRLENSSDPVLSGKRRDVQRQIIAAGVGRGRRESDFTTVTRKSPVAGEQSQGSPRGRGLKPGLDPVSKPQGVAEDSADHADVEVIDSYLVKEAKLQVVKESGNPFADVIAGAAEQSMLAKSIKAGLEELGSNLSIYFGLKSAEPAKGLILHFHGGGFISQSSMSHSIYTKEWAADVKDAVVLSVDYSLAPEAQFPVALEECFYAYHWALENCASLGTKAERVVLTGDSAGGNLAVAVALKAQAWGLRQPDGICVAYPALYMTMSWSPSRLLSFFDPLLPLSVLDLCLRAYIPKGADPSGNPYISPLVASDKALFALPPVTLVVGSFDPLMDDAVVFADRMRRIGRRDVRLKVVESMPHGFLNMIQVSPQAKEAMLFMSRSIAAYLNLNVQAVEKEM